jgi:hypothetical protein
MSFIHQQRECLYPPVLWLFELSAVHGSGGGTEIRFGGTMANVAEALIEHYHKTYEINNKLWEERNQTFVFLIGTVGVATMVTLKIPEANSLLVDGISRVLDIKDPLRIQQLQNSFPFGILQSILLLAIFYLMVNLYHRTATITRNYQYLAKMEKEIRINLALPAGSVSFTREGDFYSSHQGKFLASVKWFYVFLLGALLLAFLVAKIWDDFSSGAILLGIVDVGLAFSILTYFVGYARS